MSEIVRYISGKASFSNIDETSETVKAILNNYIAELIACVVGFIVIFIVMVLVLKLLLWILDMVVSKTPVIRQENEIADSFIVNLCTKINPITYLFMLINLISN